MKNCAPALSGRPGTSTAATEPCVIFGARALGFHRVLSAGAVEAPASPGSFDSGSPPCTIPNFTIRWNVVPS